MLLEPLDSVYHSALGFITGEPYDTHHCILYDKGGWSFLAQSRDKHLYLFIYKSLIGHPPPYITTMLDWTTGPYQTRSTNCLMLQVSRVYSELGKSAFSFCEPNTWNYLQHILRINTLTIPRQFKAMISNHFTSEYCSL